MKLDCGHEEDAGIPVSVQQEDGTYKTVQGWTWAYSLDGKRKLCHACYAKEVLDCGHAVGVVSHSSSGYGTTVDGKKICYACCSEMDKKDMVESGKATLYLTESKREVPLSASHSEPARSYSVKSYEVTNWPGTLRFTAYVTKGRHNIAGTRHDVWFSGPDGKKWYGVQYGKNTQICRCRRLKVA